MTIVGESLEAWAVMCWVGRSLSFYPFGIVVELGIRVGLFGTTKFIVNAVTIRWHIKGRGSEN